MKIATIVGARPQFIKAAVVSRAFREHRPEATEILIHTGQHYDANMSDVFFEELDIPPPKYNLGIGGGTHGQNTGRMIEAIEDVLLREKPDWVLVYGDTDSTLAGALAAIKVHILVAHVEAGLRSFNRRMPEEINRVLTDHASDVLFAPTQTAVKNLAEEGIRGDKVKLVGDVMYDAALYYGQIAEEKSCILNQLELKSKGYILATVHRAENTDYPGRLTTIFQSFSGAPLPVVIPLHPRTRNRINNDLLSHPNLKIIDPIGYLDMMLLEKHAAIIATDSGGMQKEAYFHRVPCIILREETEWIELVEMGFNHIVNCNSKFDIRELLYMRNCNKLSCENDIYGDGKAGNKIVYCLKSY